MPCFLSVLQSLVSYIFMLSVQWQQDSIVFSVLLAQCMLETLFRVVPSAFQMFTSDVALFLEQSCQ